MGNSNSSSSSTKSTSTYFYENESKEDRDELEHLGHLLVREIFKMNFSSPILDVLKEPGTKVLDVGCGSGFWLTEMAADFPKASYFGIDVLPVFPKSTFPSNVRFFQHDILERLPFDDNTFDCVHMQFLSSEFTEAQWEIVYKELARVLKPGGWLENCDLEYGILRSGPMTKKLDSAVLNNLISRDINPYMFIRNQSLIETIPSLSSSDVRHEKRKYPLGSGMSKLGDLCATHIAQRFRLTLQSPIGQELNIKKKDIDLIIREISKEFEINDSYFFIHRFYVQKEDLFTKKFMTYY